MGGERAFDAIVLAGGAARRLGGVDKPGLVVGGVALLDHVLAAVSRAGVLVVVGSPRPVTRAVVWRREQPVGSGPLAALAAGVTATRAAVVVTLAADLPAVGPAVPLLVDALGADGGTAGVAVLVDSDGQRNYLAAAWRRSALERALAAVEPAGGSMRSLFARAAVVEVPDTGAWGRDCDTWDDVAAARHKGDAGRRDGEGAGRTGTTTWDGRAR